MIFIKTLLHGDENHPEIHCENHHENHQTLLHDDDFIDDVITTRRLARPTGAQQVGSAHRAR